MSEIVSVAGVAPPLSEPISQPPPEDVPAEKERPSALGELVTEQVTVESCGPPPIVKVKVTGFSVQLTVTTGLIVRGKVALARTSLASVTVRITENVPMTEGEPVICPVVGEMERPV